MNVIGILWRLQKTFIFVNIWNFVCRGHNFNIFTIFFTKTLQFLSLFWLSIISCSYSTVDFDFHGCFHWRQKIDGNFKHHYLKKKEAIVHTFSIYKYRRCRGVGAGWAGWARAHPLFCLIFIEKERLVGALKKESGTRCAKFLTMYLNVPETHSFSLHNFNFVQEF